jgi:non-ribosomal peptide synthetase component F
VDWLRGTLSPEELAGVLAGTSIGFDISVVELFVPLSCGGKVILAQNALELPRLAARDEITLINTVPSAIEELVRTGIPSSVLVINLAGEPLRGALAERVHRAGVARLWNLYGPSEDATYSTGTEVGTGRVGAPTGRLSCWGGWTTR